MFHAPATPAVSTLSLHDALPVCAMDKGEFEAWLGVKVGETALPANARDALAGAWDAGVILPAHVMVDETVLDEGKMAEAVELWHSFYEDACKEMKLPNRKSDRIQLGTWLRGRYLSEDVIVGVSTPKPKVITAEQRADMDAQGATELWHLGYTELSLATGRAVAKEETEKYAHKAPWTVMVGGALSIKHKHTSLDDLIAAAEASGDMSAIDEHMNSLSKKRSRDADRPSLSSKIPSERLKRL